MYILQDCIVFSAGQCCVSEQNQAVQYIATDLQSC